MNCEWAEKNMSLFLYGELLLDEEQAFQDHVESCQRCGKALEREKAIHQLLDEREVLPEPALLTRCRRDLDLRMSASPRRGRWWAWLTSLTGPSFARPAAALALLALGFFGGRLITSPPPTIAVRNGGAPDSVMRVRYLQPEPSGRVQLVVEETRQRMLTGDPQDESIRRLLLAAARESSDPGVRAESMDLLRARSGSDEVRSALVYALEHDPNPGVRLRALDGLKNYATQPDVRTALAQALLADDNPGIRTQAIDLLIEQKEDALVGILQQSVQKENNGYVRQRCQKALEEMNASVGTF